MRRPISFFDHAAEGGTEAAENQIRDEVLHTGIVRADGSATPGRFHVAGDFHDLLHRAYFRENHVSRTFHCQGVPSVRNASGSPRPEPLSH